MEYSGAWGHPRQGITREEKWFGGRTDCLMVFNVYGPCILARVPFFHSPVEYNISLSVSLCFQMKVTGLVKYTFLSNHKAQKIHNNNKSV